MDVKVAVVQMDCTLGDVEANCRRVEGLVRGATAQGAEVIVLPELATTGYFVGERMSDLAEPVPGPTSEWVCRLAKTYGCYIAIGIIERGENGRYHDSALFTSKDGTLLGCYRKVHLFAAERTVFTPGTEPAIFDTPFGRVALTICYDLIFPEYIRALALRGAQLILNCTDWITNQWQTNLGWGGDVVSGLAATRAL